MHLVRQAMSIDHIPLDHRLSAWASRLAEIGLTPSDASTGSGVIHWFRSNSDAIFASLSGEKQRLDNAVPTNGRIIVLQPRSGRLSLQTEAGTRELTSGDLAVIDAGHSFSLDGRDDWEAMFILLPAAPLMARLGRRRVDYPVILGSTVAGQAARALVRSLVTNLDSLEQPDASAGEIALIELLASAMLGELRAPEGDLSSVQAGHFRRIAAAIDRVLSDPDLHPSRIARDEGISTRYLQRLFEIRGESFSDYVRQQRLLRCRTDLLNPDHDGDSIASIGLRWGFRDQAHFSRAFGATFGATPSEMRRLRGTDAHPYGLRGKPSRFVAPPDAPPRLGGPATPTLGPDHPPTLERHYLPATAQTVHWGYLSHSLPPALRVNTGELVTIETLTQHAADDWDRMVAGDPGAENVFAWTAEGKSVERRGAGPIDASVFGRGAGEGFGVHICTGPVYIRSAEPGDILEVEIVDIRPRPSGNPAHRGKAFASNASAWWGYHYNDLLDLADQHETVTIFEIDLDHPDIAAPLYSYRWTPQTDPYGVVHTTMDYPGVPVDHTTVEHRQRPLNAVHIPARMHFGFMGVAPREAELVDTIPPGPFGGNIDNWRAGKGSRIYLPVAVEGALFSIGDGHFAQADGEINGTALECSLTGEFRFHLHKAKQEPTHLRGLKGPLIETPDTWVIQSFSYPNYLRELGRSAQSEVYRKSTVDLALRNAFRQARRFLIDTYGFNEDEALAIMSLAVDFGITQVADGNFGAHAIIQKSTLPCMPDV